MGDFINQIYPMTSNTAASSIPQVLGRPRPGPRLRRPWRGLVQPVILSDVVVSVPVASQPVSVY